MKLLLFASLVLAPCSLAFAPHARADDAPDDTSAAGKAYRDGWWAETAGGNLTQAIDLYTKAADAEGPASVKARAIYRKAIVLQRIGKTEDAIRTLERLAKDHPGEAAVQADARARLAEWTAVDLKTSFAEWYRRYQYSPEFQAKIVDLVLKLGAADVNVGMEASNEILTIGAPAIPALRQQIESPNGTLRERVVTSLLHLGEIPSIEALRKSRGWRQDIGCWATVRSAASDVRARLRAEAKAEEPWDQGLVAALDGPLALLTWANTPGAKGVVEPFLSMAPIWDKSGPEPKELRAPLKALAENRTLGDSPRRWATSWLFAIHGVDVAMAETWAGSDDVMLRQEGVGFLATPGGGADSWAAMRRLLKLAPQWEMGQARIALCNGVISGIGDVPAQEELDRLADDLLLIQSGGRGTSTPQSTAARAVLARMVDRAPDAETAYQLYGSWQRPGSGTESNVDQLATWTRSTR